VQAFESPAMRARIADLLRREGVVADVPTPVGPHRYISLWWESAGDELAFSDGARSGAGQLNHWHWLEYVRFGGPIYGWLVEHQVNLGSSDDQATHALLVDSEASEAYIVPIAAAHRIVRAQSLEAEPWLLQRRRPGPHH
jgi:hypothetical protein